MPQSNPTNISVSQTPPSFDQGTLFIGTEGDGLIIQKTDALGNTTFSVATERQGLGSNFVSSVLVDFDNTVWVGTYHPTNPEKGGVSVSRDFGVTWETFRTNGVYDTLNRRRQTNSTGLLTNNIRDIKRDRLTSKLVIGTDDGVAVTSVVPSNILPLSVEASEDIDNNIEFDVFTTVRGLASNQITSILVEERSVPTARTDEPNIRTVWWATTTLGVSYSIDQGTTWSPIDLRNTQVDTSGPSILIVAPDNNSIAQGIVTITVQAVDNSGIEKVEASFDNENFFELSLVEGNYTIQYDTRKLQNGRTFLFARSTDLLGNTSLAIPLILTISNPLPASLLQIEIIDPQEEATVSGVFPVVLRIVSDVAIRSASITDNVPAGTFQSAKLVKPPSLVDGSLTLFESFYEIPYDTTSLPTGTRVTITGRVTDENGQLQQTTRTFLIFNRLPETRAIAVNGHTIWAGTVDRCGLSLSINNGLAWKYFTTEDGLSSNQVHVVAIRKEEVWVGTDRGLNYSTDQGKTWKVFTSIADRLPGQDVRSIAFQGKRVWVGTTNGIGYINNVGESFKVFRVSEGLSANQVNHIFIDCNQTCVWASTNNGISFTNDLGVTWTVLRSDRTGLSSNMVNAITRFKGNLYAATSPNNGLPGGLSVSGDEGKTFVPIRAPKIGSDNVLSLKVDGAELWIGTTNGLTKLDAEGRFTTYRREGVFSEIGQQLSGTNIGLKSNIINFLAQ